MRESAGSTAIEPLPAGRHRLDPTAVAASQRYRIDFAALDVLAEKGYAAATVADIITSARVSRRTFYEFYANKGECFVAVCALATRIMAEELDAATDTSLPWELQLRAHIQRYLDVLAAQPGAAYALTVQTFATPELRQAPRGDVRQSSRSNARTSSARPSARSHAPPPARRPSAATCRGLRRTAAHESARA